MTSRKKNSRLIRHNLEKVDEGSYESTHEYMHKMGMITEDGWNYQGAEVYDITTRKINISETFPRLHGLFLGFTYSKKAKNKKFKLTVYIHIDQKKEDDEPTEYSKDFYLINPSYLSKNEEKELRDYLDSFGLGLTKYTWEVILVLGIIIDLFESHDREEFNRLWPDSIYKKQRQERTDPESWIIPYPYLIDFDNGKLIKQYSRKNEEESYDETISDLVVVTAEYQDMAADDEIYLKYLIRKGQNKSQQFLMSASQIGQELLDEVRRRAFIIYGEEKNFMKFLTTFAMQKN